MTAKTNVHGNRIIYATRHWHKMAISLLLLLCAGCKDDDWVELNSINYNIEEIDYYNGYEFEGSFRGDTLSCVIISQLHTKKDIAIKDIHSSRQDKKINIYVETSHYFPESQSDTVGVKIIPCRIKFDIIRVKESHYNILLNVNGATLNSDI